MYQKTLKNDGKRLNIRATALKRSWSVTQVNHYKGKEKKVDYGENRTGTFETENIHLLNMNRQHVTLKEI